MSGFNSKCKCTKQNCRSNMKLMSTKKLPQFSIIAISIYLLTVLSPVTGQDFGYDGKKGPSHWGEQYNTCFGKYQSPIDIDSLAVKPVQLPPLKLKGFDLRPNQTTITNNGHTVMVTIESEERPSITGGPLSGIYEFEQLHFHWGDNDTMGSEDSIDGQSFPMELHMVFYKKLYRNIRSAMKNSDGLAVLAFFYHVDDNDNSNYVEFTQLLMNVSEPDMNVSFQQTKSISEVLLPKLEDYYTYHGSLTTPPCSEVVTWIDFKQSIPLSHAQIEIFRTIHDDEGHQLMHNFRPIQPINDRVVYYVLPGHPVDPNFDLNHPRLDEPSQDIDGSSGPIGKHDKLTGNAVPRHADDNSDDIDKAAPHLLGSFSNSLEAETTTVDYHPKSGEQGKSDAVKTVFVANGLVAWMCGVCLMQRIFNRMWAV